MTVKSKQKVIEVKSSALVPCIPVWACRSTGMTGVLGLLRRGREEGRSGREGWRNRGGGILFQSKNHDKGLKC